MTLPYFKNADTRWGSGTGAGVDGRLTSLQGDENIWNLHSRVTTLEDAGAVGVSNITTDGGTLTVHLSDGTMKGPFALPIAKINPVGPWTNDQTLHYLDLVSVAGVGQFLVLEDHTTDASPATFDPNATDGTTANNALYYRWGPAPDDAYDVMVSATGALPGDSGILAQVIIPRSIEIIAPVLDAFAYLATAAQVTTQTLELEKWTGGTGEDIGSITFTPGTDVDTGGGQTGTITFAATVSFAAGDRLIVRASASADVANTAGDVASDFSLVIPAARLDV